MAAAKEPSYPNLSGLADPGNVSTKKGGAFSAEYINWARTLQDIREAAPGWFPEAVPVGGLDGLLTHFAPDGSCYLMIRWHKPSEDLATPCIPHAIMDARYKSIPKDKVSSRDIADGFVRGACKAAAAHFGYAWQMWSKDDPMERDEVESGMDNRTTVMKKIDGMKKKMSKEQLAQMSELVRQQFKVPKGTTRISEALSVEQLNKVFLEVIPAVLMEVK